MAKVSTDLSKFAAGGNGCSGSGDGGGDGSGGSEYGGENNTPAKPTYANRIDLLRARADILTGKDRALLKMYLENGSTISHMARLMGINEATVCRRIHRLTERLLDGEYITCLRNKHQLSRLEMNVARDYFLEGLSQNKIAIKRRTTVYMVRKGLRNIQELVRVSE
jgi:transposase-like protein